MPGGPDDPNRGSHPGPDEDFDWLYGDKSSGTADDRTRMIPTTPRPQPARQPQAPRQAPRQTQPGRQPQRPGSPPLTPGPGGRILPPAGGAPRSGVRIRWRRVLPLIIFSLIIIWLLWLIVPTVSAWKKIDRVNAFPAGARPAEGKGTNFLLVGSDSRRGLRADQRHKLGLGDVAQDAGRTDTIMLLHTGNGPSTLISIPRDSWVTIPGYGRGKINSAFYYGGPKLLVQTLEKSLNLRIDHFVEIGLGGFVNAVDAVGGVRICPKRNINDHLAGLNIKKGCQIADGTTALGWARSRHAFGLGDIARAEHQRQIVKQVGNKAKSIWNVLLPWKLHKFTQAAVNGLRIDKSMGMWTMLSFARAMGNVHKTCTMPLADLDVDWDMARANQLMNYLRTDTTAKIPAKLCTRTGLPQ